MFLTNVYNFKYVFNSTIIKLSWHVLYYLISKNLYSLQNAQPFIFQLICMQICKWINYFLKPHNKQLNQYCLNFTIFLPKKKKFFKNGSVSGRVTGQPVFASGQRNRVRVGYFSGRVGFWAVLPCLQSGLLISILFMQLWPMELNVLGRYHKFMAHVWCRELVDVCWWCCFASVFCCKNLRFVIMRMWD